MFNVYYDADGVEMFYGTYSEIEAVAVVKYLKRNGNVAYMRPERECQ